MKGLSPLGFLLIMLFCFAPTVVWAQDDMDFSEEDAEKDPEDIEADEEEGGMEFDTTEEAGEDTVYSDEGPQSVAVVALPSSQPDEGRRSQIQAEMMRFTATVTNVTAMGAETVLPGLQSNGLEECVVEPICLAEVGEAAGVNRILIARVKEGDNGTELAIDYFDVSERLFLKYHSEIGLGGTGSIVAAVEPSLKDIFDVRDTTRGPEFGQEQSSGVVQTVLAYGTAGLAVVSLGLGIVFGLGASSANSDLEESSRNSAGVYAKTQQQANDDLRAAKSKATSANIFYGLAGGFAVASVLLFYIQGGSDIATNEELSDGRKIRDLHIAPAVSADGFGIGAGFKF